MLQRHANDIKAGRANKRVLNGLHSVETFSFHDIDSMNLGLCLCIESYTLNSDK